MIKLENPKSDRMIRLDLRRILIFFSPEQRIRLKKDLPNFPIGTISGKDLEEIFKFPKEVLEKILTPDNAEVREERFIDAFLQMCRQEIGNVCHETNLSENLSLEEKRRIFETADLAYLETRVIGHGDTIIKCDLDDPHYDCDC